MRIHRTYFRGSRRPSFDRDLGAPPTTSSFKIINCIIDYGVATRGDAISSLSAISDYAAGVKA